LKDYYLDKDLILAKNNYYLRLRNWIYELKISKYSKQTDFDSCEEYDNEDEINEQLSKFNLTTDDVIWIMFVDTLREKYEYNFNGQKINIDVDKYQYWERYELEIVIEIDEKEDKLEVAKKMAKFMEDFRKELWLNSEGGESDCKTINCAMHQNIDLYEIMTKDNI
jgi:hypothetical protein